MKIMSNKNKEKKLSIKIICGVVLGVVLVFALLHYNKPDNHDKPDVHAKSNHLSDVYNINGYEDFASAIPVQNSSGGDIGRIKGEDICSSSSSAKKLYNILQDMDVSTAENKQEYQINGYVLHYPILECSTKGGKNFTIQWDYPSNILRISDKIFSIGQEDAEQLYQLFQEYHSFRGNTVQ